MRNGYKVEPLLFLILLESTTSAQFSYRTIQIVAMRILAKQAELSYLKH